MHLDVQVESAVLFTHLGHSEQVYGEFVQQIECSELQSLRTIMQETNPSLCGASAFSI